MRFLKIRKAIKNQRREYENRVNKNQKPEGEIDILKTGSKNNSNNSQAGEYVDFEEVDE